MRLCSRPTAQQPCELRERDATSSSSSSSSFGVSQRKNNTHIHAHTGMPHRGQKRARQPRTRGGGLTGNTRQDGGLGPFPPACQVTLQVPGPSEHLLSLKATCCHTHALSRDGT
ncbi:hypothetical protein PLESTB_000321700 [Pleodorina starrii]|uniref:Uncharacterized protein n=1 Tax=Pleodorina starrii TaxID=330485 RepID=A0A9W6EZA2_9CHLO|nr:hypothetical protein PLESTB_000321700 [Pleodorina starrii]